MSKWSRDSDESARRIARALVVQAFSDEDVDALEYLGRRSRADGRCQR